MNEAERRPCRILSVLVRAGVERYPSAEADLSTLFARQLPNVSRQTIIIDNLLPAGVHEQGPERVLIGGDNEFWEFSGFDVAIRHAGASLFEYDWVHLATSAFGELYTAYLEHFTGPVLEVARDRGVCLGHIDYYNEAVRVCGYPSQHWIRTSFLMLPPHELALLGSVVSLRDTYRLFSGDVGEPFRNDAPISDRLKRYIIDWLTGRDIGHNVTWHSKLGLDGDMLPMFEAKALAILNEHMLGIRLRSRGCVLADVTWVASELRARREVRWDLPWRDQMASTGRHVPEASTV